MEKYLNLLSQTALFEGVSSEDLPLMLNCLGAYQRTYAKDEYLLHLGEPTSALHIVLEGNVFLVRDDYAGNRKILASIAAGQLFAETFACLHGQCLNFDAITQEPTEVLSLEIAKVLHTCTSACQFHNKVIQNLLYIMAEQNLGLSVKMEHLCQRTTREKLLSYLAEQCRKQQCAAIDIPFNRQQLADYLSVDRSAMSKELSRLREEGIIAYHKNHFRLQTAVE